jgi:hypothetical protein
MGADYSIVELELWNRSLQSQNWQVLLGSGVSALGLFVIDPRRTTVPELHSSLSDCGIPTAPIERNRFTSPPVPAAVQIRTPVSRELSGPIGQIILKHPEIDLAILTIRNPRWVRFEPNASTSFIHSSPIWSNPTARAALIKCVGERKAGIVADSILLANVVLEFRDAQGKLVDVDSDMRSLREGEFMYGALISKGHRYSAHNANLGRRAGVCIDESIFFNVAAGRVGSEDCSRVASVEERSAE